MRFFNRTVLLSHPNGDRTDYIPPCGTFSFEFEVESRDIPITHSFRLIGEPDYFWKWRCEAGSPYSISMSIDDALSKADTFRETYSLKFDCANEPYERNAWIKLYQEDLSRGEPYRFSFAGKTDDLRLEQGGAVCAELEIYLKKDGRHPNDVFDAPDEVKRLTLPEGSYDWRELDMEFVMPEQAVCVIVHIGIKGVSGKLLLASPRLCPKGGDNVIPPYDRQQKREPKYCYVAENMSRRDWAEFECFVDGKCIFSGEKYSSIFRRPDCEIEIGMLAPGKHIMTLNFRNDYESAVGFVVQQLELLEYGNHAFEIIAVPEHLRENEPCRVLIKTPHENLDLEADGKTYKFTAPGLHALILPPLREDVQTITLKANGFSDSFTVRKTLSGCEALYLSTGDTVFAPQTLPDMERFLEWYLGNNLGNTICFRHSYRWGGGRFMNAEIWRKVLPLLREMGMHYILMIDGRELPGKNANPPESLIAGEGYLGRQAHENDGAFYYWGNTLWKPEPLLEPYADIFSRSVDKGGIQPHVRPKRNGSRAWWFFDPTDARDMKEAAEAIVRNIADAKGDSNRHSGPSTLFRYFFQAGYEFLLAEQMYGPEEVILSSLRGASKAYGANGFGAHLATQWSSTPHDTPEHAERYFLSLATCYIQGVTQINTEEGLDRMEKGFVDHDRFGSNCLRHQEAHTRFRRFMETHPRNGKIVVPIACIQGRFDGWCCFTRDNVWKREGDQWKFGEAEESFDLLNVFYPRSVFSDIYRCPCSVAPQGWYTGTPYGPIDLVPFEGEWNSYQAVIFLGWHTFQSEDGKKMLEYVQNGGTLLLSKRHLSTALEHDSAPIYQAEATLNELLGENWHNGMIRRKIGAGEVICFTEELFPANPQIRANYENEMKKIAENICRGEAEKCWVEANEDVNFSVYEDENGNRAVYLLNIRWWDKKSSTVTLTRNGQKEPIILEEGIILQK